MDYFLNEDDLFDDGLEWKVFISSKPRRPVVVPRQEFTQHMFDKLLFFFLSSKIAISYKEKNVALISFNINATSSYKLHLLHEHIFLGTNIIYHILPNL